MMEWTDKDNCIAIIPLHKCGIERAHIFEFLKPLNITRVFVFRTVELFLDRGGVSDHKRSRQHRMVRTPKVINAITITVIILQLLTAQARRQK